jgi:hypothetical protein
MRLGDITVGHVRQVKERAAKDGRSGSTGQASSRAASCSFGARI